MKKCFFVSPIGDDGSDIRNRSDQLFKHLIEPICKKYKLGSVRLDHINNSGSITEELIKNLKQSDLVIADLTDHNPNVFFEIGYRTALDLPIIHLIHKDYNIPFDVTTIKTYKYDLSLDNTEDLKYQLSNIIESYNFSEDDKNKDNDNDNEHKDKINNYSSVFSKNLELQYEILDSIKELKELVKNKDDSTIQKIVEIVIDKSQSPETPETAIIKSVMPELINNPDKFFKIMNLANKTK